MCVDSLVSFLLTDLPTSDIVLDFDLSTVGIKKAGCTVTSAGESNTMVMIWTALMAWNTGKHIISSASIGSLSDFTTKKLLWC